MTGLAAVTGATGFLGREIVRALQSDGWRVRALARRDSDLDVETVRGHLADPEALDALCAGADLVVHCAGVVKARTRREFFAVNAMGAGHVAHAAREAPRVILVSSLVAREPQLSGYAASKREGERAMRALGERLSIARPPAIYGPGDRELLPVFLAAQASPVLPIFDPARIAMIHVEDAARQVVGLAALPGGVTVGLSDSRPDGYSWRELMASAATAVGRTPALVPAPRFALRGMGFFNDLAASLGRNPMLRSGKSRELLHPDWALTPEERSAALPAARYTLDAGFSQTVAWYRTAAWMKQ